MQKQVQIVIPITTIKMQEYTEMRCMKRVRAVVEHYHGMESTLTFLAGTLLSLNAEVIMILVLLLACFIFFGTVAVDTATVRSVRSWSQFRCVSVGTEIFDNYKKFT